MSVHTLHPTQEQTPAPAPEAFVDAVLDILAAATWPDGSPLIDVAPTVLRDRVATQILAAAHVLAAVSALNRGGLR